MAIQSRSEGTTLSVSGAARLLGVHANTIRAWTDQGRLSCIRINDRGDRRYSDRDLLAFLADAGLQPGIAAPFQSRLRPAASRRLQALPDHVRDGSTLSPWTPDPDAVPATTHEPPARPRGLPGPSSRGLTPSGALASAGTPTSTTLAPESTSGRSNAWSAAALPPTHQGWAR